MSELVFRGFHPGQQALIRAFEDPSIRYVVAACGRRWGKTSVACAIAVMAAARGNRVWWVGPTFPLSTIGWNKILRILSSIAPVEPTRGQAYRSPFRIVRAERVVEFKDSGGFIQIKSAHDPDSLRGEGLDLVVVDEAAFVRPEAWENGLRPALADRQGKAIFISTPKGLNWFYQLFLRGKEGTPGWFAMQSPTWENPRIAKEEIEDARAVLPELVFLQEIQAQFVSDVGAVFRKVMEAAVLDPLPAGREGKRYLIGVDLAKIQDFTAVAVLEIDSGDFVYVDRFRGIEYVHQVERIAEISQRYHAEAVIVERNNVGEPVIEMLSRKGLRVVPFTTTLISKRDMIEKLALAFEQGKIRIPRDPDLVAELQAFEARTTPSGLTRYSAPAGGHDDRVIAMALAWNAMGSLVSPSEWIAYMREENRRIQDSTFGMGSPRTGWGGLAF